MIQRVQLSSNTHTNILTVNIMTSITINFNYNSVVYTGKYISE